MNVELLYFSDCPNWHIARERLAQALRRNGRPDAQVNLVEVTTEEQAQALHFPGSPTVRIDGLDPFPSGNRVGLACRVYSTPLGLAGSPTLDQLTDAISSATKAS